MWGPAARAMDLMVACLVARKVRFFGNTGPSDYRRSFHDYLRERLKYEARICPPSSAADAYPPVAPGRRSPPSARLALQIDRGGEIVDTCLDYFARGYRGRTLIVYHHGLGEIPQDMSFRWAFLRAKGPEIPADFICYRATAHRTYRELNQLLSTLGGFQKLVGDGMMGIRAIARAYRRHYERVVFVGASLGGIVGIAEAAMSGSFDLNVSLIAHLDLVEVITLSSFRHLIDKDFRDRCPAELIRAGIDADRFAAAAQRRLVMINGIHDGYFRIDRAREWWARFGRIGHYEIRQGHISAALATRTLRRILLDALYERRILAT
jgi:hypothetical protein